MSSKKNDYKKWLSGYTEGEKYFWSTWLALETADAFVNLGGGACFATLNDRASRNTIGAEKVWHYKIPTFLGKEAAEAEEIYYPWLLNESPWAEAFIEKDYGKVKEGGFCLTGHVHPSFLLSALCATRFLTEKYCRGSALERVAPFTRAIKLGENVLWSYLFSQLYAPVHGQKPTGFKFSPYATHHTLPVPLEMRDLKNIVTKNPKVDKETFYTHPGYRGITHIWKHGNDVRKAEVLAQKWGVSTVDSADYNIFRVVNKITYPVLVTDKEVLSALESMKKDTLND